MKNLAILGSTGSIGKSTLRVVRSHANRFRVVSLAAGSNWELCARQVQEFNPLYVSMADPEAAGKLKDICPGISIGSGPESVIEAALHDEVDTVLAAIVGQAGLESTYRAALKGKRIALANKESLVMAGPLFKRIQADIIPVDSEHAALHQVLRCGHPREVRRLILTASGGPFLKRPTGTFHSITVEEALAHPTWSMGPKISIDSATMVNKALEVIEAHFLFEVEPEYINVLIHPQSLIHSMAEFVDGTIAAQLSPNDMTFPIQYALTWPERLPAGEPRLDLSSLKELTFQPPDGERFPCLSLAYQALKMGESAPAVLSVANEIAVDAFLKKKILFNEISSVLENVLSSHEPFSISTLEDVFRVAESTVCAAREEIDTRSREL